MSDKVVRARALVMAYETFSLSDLEAHYEACKGALMKALAEAGGGGLTHRVLVKAISGEICGSSGYGKNRTVDIDPNPDGGPDIEGLPGWESARGGDLVEIEVYSISNPPTQTTIEAPACCFGCGSEMPWHLFAVADQRYRHHCKCGRIYGWMDKKTAVVTA